MFSSIRSRGGPDYAAPRSDAACPRSHSNGCARGPPASSGALGPLFPRERPARGTRPVSFTNRCRGPSGQGTDVDARIILLSAALVAARIGLTRTKLMVTPWEGTPASRAAYRDQLQRLFSGHEASLDEGSKRAAQGNDAPYRQQESGMQRIVAGAPLVLRLLGAEVAGSFELCALTCQTPESRVGYQPHPGPRTRLLHRTVFEWTTDAIG